MFEQLTCEEYYNNPSIRIVDEIISDEINKHIFKSVKKIEESRNEIITRVSFELFVGTIKHKDMIELFTVEWNDLKSLKVTYKFKDKSDNLIKVIDFGQS